MSQKIYNGSDDKNDVKPRNIRTSLEVLANLLYLAKHEETHSQQRKFYLERAEEELSYLISILKLVG